MGTGTGAASALDFLDFFLAAYQCQHTCSAQSESKQSYGQTKGVLTTAEPHPACVPTLLLLSGGFSSGSDSGGRGLGKIELRDRGSRSSRCAQGRAKRASPLSIGDTRNDILARGRPLAGSDCVLREGGLLRGGELGLGGGKGLAGGSNLVGGSTNQLTQELNNRAP